MAIRTERLKEVIRETAAEFIQRELSDPRLGFCTVTRVDLSADLSFATVFVSVLGEEAQKRTTMRCLADARGMLQARIAKMLKTRTTPHVTIELDESIERSFRILEKIKEARASDTDHGKDTEEPKNASGEEADDGEEAQEGEEDSEAAEEETAEDESEPGEEPEEKPKAPAKRKRSKRQEKDHA